MRILGIDPGLLRTGFGIVESKGNQSRHIAHGVIRIGASNVLSVRLRRVFDGVRAVIEEHRPDVAVIEQVFVNVNPQTTLLLGQACGAAIAALATADLPVAEYGAMQIKQAVTGRGRATKDQVQQLVATLLGLAERPPKDAADALACALCHAHSGLTTHALMLADDAPSGTLSLRRGRLSSRSAGPAPALPPMLAALGLRVRRGRLVPP